MTVEDLQPPGRASRRFARTSRRCRRAGDRARGAHSPTATACATARVIDVEVTSDQRRARRARVPDRALPGRHRAQARRRRARRRARPGGRGVEHEVGVPRQRQPRGAHADERRARHDRAAARHGAHGRAARRAPSRSRARARRCSRSSTTSSTSRRSRPATSSSTSPTSTCTRRSPNRARPPAAQARAKGLRLDVRIAERRPAARARRRPAPAPGAAQPRLQRDQVHLRQALSACAIERAPAPIGATIVARRGRPTPASASIRPTSSACSSRSRRPTSRPRACTAAPGWAWRSRASSWS